MSSEARPACCAGARLSHQPPVPQETNAGEHQQLLHESTKKPGLLKSVTRSISRGIAQGEGPPVTPCSPTQQGLVIALIKAKESPRQLQLRVNGGKQPEFPDTIEMTALRPDTVSLS